MFADKYDYLVFVSSVSLSKLKSTKFPPPLRTPSQFSCSLFVAQCWNKLVVCFSTAPDKKKKQKRKNVEHYGEKAQIYFTGKICLYFIWQVFFCKIDLKLDIISF